jgi:trimethylamine--corrinoid protein Co-methyltransferase
MNDMARYYKLPMFGTAGCSDAKVIDSQTGSESANSILISTMNGQNLIHDIGYLDSGLVVSYDHYVLANELIAQAKFIAGGITVDEGTLATGVINEVANKKSYIEADHTLEYLRDEFYFPNLAERDNYSNWEKKGKPRQEQVIDQKVRHILKTHQPPQLSPAVLKEMEKVTSAL